MKKLLVALAAAGMLLLGLAPSSSAQDAQPADNCGPGPNGYTWYQEDCPTPLDGGSDDGGSTDGGSTDGYVPGDGGGDGETSPEHNCGPGPNGYTWYQQDCPTPVDGETSPEHNCGPGPNGWTWYQQDCPNPIDEEVKPSTYWCGPGEKGFFWEQATPCADEYSGPGELVVLSPAGQVLGTASADAAVATVAAASVEQTVILADAATGEVLGTSTVAAGSTIAAARASVTTAGAAALPNTGANSMNVAQMALGLIAAGGLLTLISRKREATSLAG